MKNVKKFAIITWSKRFITVSAILLWGFILWSISKSSAPFMEQAPYCMVSTMLVFGLLSAAYKGLDYWGENQKKR
ncbi:MAG: hypothetical protein RL113_478 [Pseudomonadota bacterium]|jgi:hypothetical protein